MLGSEQNPRVEAPIRSRVLGAITTTELSVKHFSIDVAKLGASRLRVAHVSDLHVTSSLPWSYFQDIHARVRSLNPDLIVMTGDYVSHADRIGLFARWLETLPETPLGAYATLGNHDYGTKAPEEVRRALRNAGVRVIGGTWQTLETAGGALRICGTDAPWGPGLRGLHIRDDGLPLLALTHSPDNVYALRELGVTAVFAVHTHGGQIRLPGLGALLVPSRFGRRFDRGHFIVEQTHMFVSAGLGADAPPLRLWCPPELVVVDLVHRDRSELI
jgi:predicted MPP superfamily phosphohydrolase